MSHAIFAPGYAPSYDAGNGWEARFVRSSLDKYPLAIVYVHGANGEPSSKRATFAAHLAAIDAVRIWRPFTRARLLAALCNALPGVEIDGATVLRDTLLAFVDAFPPAGGELAAVALSIGDGQTALGLAVRWTGTVLVVAPCDVVTRISLDKLEPWGAAP